jgi:hypothetical protein
VCSKTINIKSISFLISAAIVLIGVGILYTGLPGSPDQIELDYLAWLVLDGGIPYVDFVDNNWPGGYLLHMVSTILFGNTLHSWRILDYLIMVAGLACLADLLRRTFGVASACWAILLYPGLYAASYSFWFAGQRDATIGNLFWVVVWSYWAAWSQKKPVMQVLSGSFIAIAVLLKPTAIFIGPLLALHLVLWSFRGNQLNLKDVLLHIIGAVIGFTAVLIFVFGVVVIQGASIQAIFDSVWLYNLYSQGDPSITINYILKKAFLVHLESWHWITAVGIISILFVSLNAKEKSINNIFLYATIWLTGWISYVVQGRGFIYHLGVVYAGMLPFLFIGLGRLSEVQTKNLAVTKKIFAFIGISIVILGSAKKIYSTFSDTYAWRTGKLQTEQYYDKYSAGDNMSLGDVYRLMPFLASIVPKGETLLMIGTQSATNYLLERRQPIRFYYFPIFLEARAPINFVVRWNEIFRKEISQIQSPIALVNRSFLMESPKSESKITENSLVILSKYLEEKYEKVSQHGSVDLYRRR